MKCNKYFTFSLSMYYAVIRVIAQVEQKRIEQRTDENTRGKCESTVCACICLTQSDCQNLKVNLESSFTTCVCLFSLPSSVLFYSMRQCLPFPSRIRDSKCSTKVEGVGGLCNVHLTFKLYASILYRSN